jgi:hypothetical protein
MKQNNNKYFYLILIKILILILIKFVNSEITLSKKMLILYHSYQILYMENNKKKIKKQVRICNKFYNNWYFANIIYTVENK